MQTSHDADVLYSVSLITYIGPASQLCTSCRVFQSRYIAYLQERNADTCLTGICDTIHELLATYATILHVLESLQNALQAALSYRRGRCFDATTRKQLFSKRAPAFPKVKVLWFRRLVISKESEVFPIHRVADGEGRLDVFARELDGK